MKLDDVFSTLKKINDKTTKVLEKCVHTLEESKETMKKGVVFGTMMICLVGTSLHARDVNDPNSYKYSFNSKHQQVKQFNPLSDDINEKQRDFAKQVANSFKKPASVKLADAWNNLTKG